MVNKLMAGVRNFNKVSQRKALVFIIVSVLLVGGSLGVWVWQMWNAKPPAPTAEGSAAAAVEYINARTTYKTKVIAVDAGAKKLKVLNIELNTEQSYAYTNDTLFVKGVANDDMAVDSIKKDDTLYVTVNTDANVAEAVWQP